MLSNGEPLSEKEVDQLKAQGRIPKDFEHGREWLYLDESLGLHVRGVPCEETAMQISALMLAKVAVMAPGVWKKAAGHIADAITSLLRVQALFIAEDEQYYADRASDLIDNLMQGFVAMEEEAKK